MRELLISCVVLLAAVTNVQGSVIYRKYREIAIPVENVQTQEGVQSVVAELRKEAVPVEMDVAEPVVLLKEEVILPVDSVSNVEPLIEAEEAAPVLNEILPKSIQDELPADNYLPESIEEPSDSQSEPQKEVTGDQIILNDDNSSPALKQSGNTTSRPTIFQQAQQSFGQFIDTIRRPLTSTRAPGDAAVETSTNPNLLQQFQASVQNLGSQITNALLPNPNTDAVSTPRPPNILENLQTNFQNVVSNVFRPPTEPTSGANPTPIGPLQAVISNVQSFFTGNRGAEQQTQQGSKPEAVEDPNKPVDDKIDQNLRDSEENRESLESSQQDIVVGEPDDSAE